MMFERILVPVDLTEKNRSAVETARQLALESEGRVTLLHVIEMLDLPFEEVEEFYRELERKAGDAMGRLAGILEDAGVEHTLQVGYGQRAAEIVEFADEHDFDLIVLTSHRTDLENPAEDWATLSHKVAILAQCPVLLVK